MASIVLDYSQRSSSFFEGKLNALAGIASELREIWKDEYVAGLWRRLAWARVFPRHTAFSRPASYRAPSWSWASVDGEINSNLLHSVDAEVVECQVHPISSDAPLAEVRDATLVVKVSMFSATPTDYKLENWEFHMDSSTPLGSEKISQYALIGWKVSAKARDLVLMSIV
jgi:hypothetical protein